MEKCAFSLDSRPFKPGFRNTSVQFVLRHITKNCFFTAEINTSQQYNNIPSLEFDESIRKSRYSQSFRRYFLRLFWIAPGSRRERIIS